MRSGAWTAEETGRARELHRMGFTMGTVAGTINAEFGTARTGKAVASRLEATRNGMGEKRKPGNRVNAAIMVQARKPVALAVSTKPRKCLCCSGTFASEGPGNRICSPCKSVAAWS